MGMTNPRSEEPQQSRFAETLFDVLDRVHYARIQPDAANDPVYHLRYQAYRRENYLPFSDDEVYSDDLDLTPNCYCFGIFIDDKLVSSLRLHHITPEERRSPSMSVYGDILNPLLDKGMSFVDPTRFSTDREAMLAFPALPFLGLRLPVMASTHFGVDYALSSVRPEHATFYKRVFFCDELGPQRSYSSLNFQIVLLATPTPVTMPNIVARRPFFDSTPEERRKLFGPEGRLGVGEPVTATARMAQELRQRLEAAE